MRGMSYYAARQESSMRGLIGEAAALVLVVLAPAALPLAPVPVAAVRPQLRPSIASTRSPRRRRPS
jgi:hypothetical protein